MEIEKRKREDEDEDIEDKQKKGKGLMTEEDGGVKVTEPADEEVEEFFARLRRVQVAVKYFKERSSREWAAMPWSPSFELEDFAGVKKESVQNMNAGLDLNSDPVSEQDAET